MNTPEPLVGRCFEFDCDLLKKMFDRDYGAATIYENRSDMMRQMRFGDHILYFGGWYIHAVLRNGTVNALVNDPEALQSSRA